MISLLDLSWGTGGLLRGEKIINTLVRLLGDKQIDDLPLKYTAVATDIKNEKEVWIKSGRLFDAIRASISLPLFLIPFERKGLKLIDGGILNPVPIAPTFEDETDVTIAVNIGGDIDEKRNIEKVEVADSEHPNRFKAEVDRFIDLFQESDNKEKSSEWGIYDIVNQAFDAMQNTIARQKLAAYPPDYTINISRNACGLLEFDRAAEMIAIGYKKAEESNIS